MPPQVVSPFINGHRYSFGSVEIIANGQLFYGITRVAYGSSLKPGHIQGSDTEWVGRTPGEAEHRCELEMYQHEFEKLVAKLGTGFGLRAFDVVVVFDERQRYEDNEVAPEGVKTHRVMGCRITDVDFQSAQGVDANVVRLTLDPRTIGYGADYLTIDWRADNSVQNANDVATHVEEERR